MKSTSTQNQPLYSFAGYCAIAGAVSMLIGAALWGATGLDLWQTLDNDQMAAYLSALEAAKPLLVANTSFWIVGVLLLGTAGSLMAGFSTTHPGLAQAALTSFRAAVPLGIVSFIAMLSLAVQIAPDASDTALAIAETTGWIGARTDDLATILIIGAGPLFLSLAGRSGWVPRWLQIWGFLAALTGALGIAGMIIPKSSGLSFVIIPFGIGWMIAAGIVLVRRKSG